MVAYLSWYVNLFRNRIYLLCSYFTVTLFTPILCHICLEFLLTSFIRLHNSTKVVSSYYFFTKYSSSCHFNTKTCFDGIKQNCKMMTSKKAQQQLAAFDRSTYVYKCASYRNKKRAHAFFAMKPYCIQCYCAVHYVCVKTTYHDKYATIKLIFLECRQS